MKFDTYEYRIPTWAICPLEYGDYSGLDDDDIAAIEKFVETLPRDSKGCCGHYSWGDTDSESYFAHSNDINNLGSTVVDVEYLVESIDPILNPDRELPLI